jgi:hypothetical protein
MIDAVLSYHLNPLTCGVAKFNHALARRLKVPLESLEKHPVAHPLISIKTSECYNEWPAVTEWYRTYDLFFHDHPRGLCAFGIVQKARRVYAANALIAEAIRPHNPDVITAFCPSTVEGNPTRGAYRVLTFGMAHKLVLPHFVQLKEDLDRDHPDYTLSLSTAVHEGSPWDEALTQSVEAMRGIFGDHLRVLGFLADDALAKELQDCDAVAAFFVPAFRANNTSAWAALAAGKFLYTNLDQHSPALNPEQYSWDALLQVLA